MTERQDTEPAGVGYEVCTGLLSMMSRQLDVCESTHDPWEARYRYDALMPFVATMDEQIDTLTDEAERETCREQYEQLVTKGQRIGPTIPIICIGCWDAFTNLPPEDEDEADKQEDIPTHCPACREQQGRTDE